MFDNIEIIYPHSIVLKKYIYCYYIIQSCENSFESTHYSFPHILNAISLYDNGTLINRETTTAVIGSKDYAPFCLIQGKRLKPLRVELKGKIRRITILFKELGLNSFIRKPLGDIMKMNPVVFTDWSSDSFDIILSQVFNNQNITDGIDLLENYLQAICQPLELSPLKKALTFLHDLDNEKKIQSISQSVNIPLRTFNRLFKLHLGISPSKYRQIIRFRKSLENKIFENRFKRLVELTYESNYYDQSYFNKLYGQLTGSTPKKFFNSIEKIGNTKLVLQDLDNYVG